VVDDFLAGDEVVVVVVVVDGFFVVVVMLVFGGADEEVVVVDCEVIPSPFVTSSVGGAFTSFLSPPCLNAS